MKKPNEDRFEDSFLRPKRSKELRDYILGDDWLMHYCLEVAGRDAIEKGEAACRELLDQCGCVFVQDEVDRGDDPKAIIERLLVLVEG